MTSDARTTSAWQDNEHLGGSDALMAEATLTKEMIDSMRAKVGTSLRIDHSMNNELATRLAVARFADGIGDNNPLWLDAKKAGDSSYGAPVAPPSWVLCCFSGLQFGWPGLGSFHSGSRLSFYRPVYVGDKITPTCSYLSFDGPRPSRFAGQSVTDHFLNRYHNQRNELVCEVHWTVVNYERGSAKKRASGRTTENKVQLPHPWTKFELELLEENIANEKPRGQVPRLWEEVEVGDSLCEVIKGPIGTTDEVAFVAAGGAPIRRLAAHRSALLEYRRHPEWCFRDPATNALEPIYSVHYNKQAAQQMGVAMQYDVGFQRQCWQIHLLCDWMGDDGWIKEASSQYRAFVYLSDVIRLSGQVAEKYVDGHGEHVVKVQTSAYNQRGENVMPGSAVIALPSRSSTVTPVSLRRPLSNGEQRLNEKVGLLPE